MIISNTGGEDFFFLTTSIKKHKTLDGTRKVEK